MTRVLVIGAGAQGAPCASILARDRDVAEIVLGDIDIGLANKVKEKIGSDKVTTVKLDAGKIEDIERAAKGASAIINLTLPRFNLNIKKAALRSGAHYVDAALSMYGPMWKQLIQNRPLELDSEFKEAGLTAVFACGGSPGVTNVLARYTCDRLDRVDGIHTMIASKPLKEPENIISEWSPGWCLDEALEDYEDEVDVFENGEYKRYPPFSGCEVYNFPQPVGPLLVTLHTHEEGVTPPRFIGKGIKYSDFKYSFDPIAGALTKLGLTGGEPIDVKGVKVTPRDVLMKLIRPPVNSFLEDDESTAKLPLKSLELMAMEIKGTKSGEDVTYTLSWPYFLFTNAEEKLGFYRKFGATDIAVALPAIVAAKMCMEGDAARGVIAPECLDAVKFLKRMADIGAPVKFHEVCSKEVSIS